MDILEKIVAHKKQEVEDRKELFPIKLLEKSIHYGVQPVSLRKYITREDKSGLIAEIKRKSPSMGYINKYVSVERTSIGYMQAGASALSILTDTEFFGGKNEDLTTARKYNFCPILRKDFIIDEYQVIEAKSIGADAILLIAATLEPVRIKKLAQLARSLGMEVLLEIHDAEEARRYVMPEVDLVGVNNRDLKTFKTDIQTSIDLASSIPDEFVKVSESGIEDPAKVVELRTHGYEGFLVGTSFMKNSRPEKACEKFVEELRRIDKKETA